MTPAKCPNCRLSLPQHWAGMNDPNGKCPYCGKVLEGNAPVSGGPSGPHANVSPGQPSSAPAPAQAPRAAAGAKTILWGVGAPVPGVNPPKPGTAPTAAPVVVVGQASSQAPSQPSRPAAGQAAGPSQTHASGQIGAPGSTPSSEPPASTARHATLKPALVIPAVTAPESGAINVDMDASFDAPAPESAYASTKPGGPAATMMFESAAPARQDPVYSQANYSGDVVEEEAEDNSSSRYRPAPSRSRDKDSGKKSTSSRRVVRAAEPDDDDEVPSRGSGNKGKIIGVAAVVVAGLIGVAVVVLRPKDKPADEPATAPATKAEPLAEPVFVPPPPNPALAQPVPATPPSPRKGKAVEKPVHAEKPTPLEKPKAIAEPTPAPAHAEPKAEPKSAAGKPNEEDYRRANEAYQRGNSKLFQGNTSGAITDFNEALKLNPKDAASQRGLGLAYAQTGNNAEALKHLKLYLKVSPKANDRSIIEKRIDQLRAQ